MSKRDTVAAHLTPSGRGAVATIAVRGSLACEYVARYFSPAKSADAPVNEIRFGRWRSATDAPGEELVICRTDGKTLEIHCHGGTAAVDAILADLEQAGADRITAEAWVAQATGDAIVAAAWLELANARTELTAAILLDQYRGALSQELRVIRSLLGPKTRDAALQRIDGLLALLPLGLHLTKPFRVVLAGEPNVGKSSLINALLGYDRSIVFDLPGTTRDVVSALTAFEGWPMELSDTAGMRAATDVLEVQGIERAAQQLSSADLILWVSDATAEQPSPVPAVGTSPVIAVFNKADLLKDATAVQDGCYVSAKTGAGLEELRCRIVNALVPQLPPSGAAVPFLSEHKELLERLRQQM